MNDTRRLANIEVPATPVVGRAIDYARERCEDYLFNHAMRSWLFAVRLGQLQNVDHDAEVVAVATLLHDITLNDRFAGPRRFEVEAADMARKFAFEAGMGERRSQQVWDGVALNSTPSIGLHKEAEVSLCTAGVCLDVVGLQFDALSPDEVASVVREFPRLDMKKRMTNCFCHIALTVPETTYDNFVGDFGQRFIAGYDPPSSVEWVANAPFEE